VLAEKVVRFPFPAASSSGSTGIELVRNRSSEPSGPRVNTTAVRILPPNLMAESVPGIRIEPGKSPAETTVGGSSGTFSVSSSILRNRSWSACCSSAPDHRLQLVETPVHGGELLLHRGELRLLLPRAASCPWIFASCSAIFACCSAMTACCASISVRCSARRRCSSAVVGGFGFGAAFFLAVVFACGLAGASAAFASTPVVARSHASAAPATIRRARGARANASAPPPSTRPAPRVGAPTPWPGHRRRRASPGRRKCRSAPA